MPVARGKQGANRAKSPLTDRPLVREHAGSGAASQDHLCENSRDHRSGPLPNDLRASNVWFVRSYPCYPLET